MSYYSAYNQYNNHHQRYLYGNHVYPTSSYYGGYGGGGGYGYNPYTTNSYYGRHYRPNVFSRLWSRMRYGTSNPYGYSPNVMGYDHTYHRYYPEMGQFSSVKDLWRPNDLY